MKGIVIIILASIPLAAFAAALIELLPILK